MAALALLLTACSACSGDDDSNGKPDTIQPTSERAATFFAADPGDQAAAFVAGDFNGDAVNDIALGAANADGPRNDGPDTGEVYVFDGPFAAGERHDATTANLTFFGNGPGENFGRTLAAGDFNGDAVDDLAVAAPYANDSAGTISVYFGSPNEQQDPRRTTTLVGGDAGDYAGLTMKVADLDGDGSDDLIIGALEADGPQDSRDTGGELYVVPGARLTAADATIKLNDTQNVVYGTEADDRFGEAIATGDVNGDDRPDLIAVAPFASGTDNARESAGETYVFFSPLQFPIDTATATPDITILGRDAGDQLGHAIAAGDWTGDGSDDIMLGAVSADGQKNGVDLAGEVVFVDGTSRGVVDAASADLPIVYGPEKEARLGRYGAAGDLNGDGRTDLIVSAPNLAGRAGLCYVFFGGDAYPSSVEDADLTLLGIDPGDVLGTEVFGTPPFSVADMNGDGTFELLIVAPQADGPDNARTDAGEAYVVFLRR